MPSSAKKRTAAKKQQQQQPPSAPLLSSPAIPTSSDHNPTSATATVSAVDFRTFILRAKLEDIDKFLKLASTTQDGRNLAFFWEQAYGRGYDDGRADILREELDMATEQLQNEWMQRGRAVGYKEGYKKGKEDSPQDHDIEAARTAAFKEGLQASKANLRPTAEVGIQSCAPPMVSSSAQTSSPSHVNVNMQTSVAMDSPSPVLPVSHLDWAEDATSLPIAPLLPTPSVPRQHAPRDFSGLRSSGLNPFGSLQRRSKQLCGRTPRFRHQNTPFIRPLQSYRSSPSFFTPSKHTSPPHISALNWDQDPRLLNLSQALKALGWIRP
jgi:hypothetical protein